VSESEEDFLELDVTDTNPNLRILNLIMLIIQRKSDPRLEIRTDHVRDVAIRETCSLMGLDNSQRELFDYLHEPEEHRDKRVHELEKEERDA
jgi:hypothetical protein